MIPGNSKMPCIPHYTSAEGIRRSERSNQFNGCKGSCVVKQLSSHRQQLLHEGIINVVCGFVFWCGSIDRGSSGATPETMTSEDPSITAGGGAIRSLIDDQQTEPTKPATAYTELPSFNITYLREHIAQAVSTGPGNVVTIPMGVYRGRVEDGTVFISIEGANNLTINAANVIMVCERLTRAIIINDCENLTIRGLTVDYNPLLFTQGTIVGVGGSR